GSTARHRPRHSKPILPFLLNCGIKGISMRKSPVKGGIALTGVLALTLAACSSGSTDDDGSSGGSPAADETSYTTRDVSDGTTEFTIVENTNEGKTLSFSKESGFELLEVEDDGVTYAFKDMNGNGELYPWE